MCVAARVAHCRFVKLPDEPPYASVATPAASSQSSVDVPEKLRPGSPWADDTSASSARAESSAYESGA